MCCRFVTGCRGVLLPGDAFGDKTIDIDDPGLICDTCILEYDFEDLQPQAPLNERVSYFEAKGWTVLFETTAEVIYSDDDMPPPMTGGDVDDFVLNEIDAQASDVGRRWEQGMAAVGYEHPSLTKATLKEKAQKKETSRYYANVYLLGVLAGFHAFASKFPRNDKARGRPHGASSAEIWPPAG